MNTGTIQGDTYTKYVSFSKAVLWKDRQLSLPIPVMYALIDKQIPTMIFIDRKKQETWTFQTKDVEARGEIRTVGQEPQWYFPIELAKKTKQG